MPNAGTSALLAPQHQADLLADDRVHVADDRLRHEVAVEERLRDPGRAVVGLVHEVEQAPRGVRARGGGSAGIPAIDEIAAVRLERRPQRVARDVAAGRPAAARHEQHGRGRASARCWPRHTIERAGRDITGTRPSIKRLRALHAHRRRHRRRRDERPGDTPRSRAGDRRRGRPACRAPCGCGRAPSRGRILERRVERATGARRSPSARRAPRRGSSASAPVRRTRAARVVASMARPCSSDWRATAGRPARSAVLPASSHSRRLRGYCRCSSPITRSASSNRALAVVDEDQREERVRLHVARVAGGLFDHAQAALAAAAKAGEVGHPAATAATALRRRSDTCRRSARRPCERDRDRARARARRRRGGRRRGCRRGGPRPSRCTSPDSRRPRRAGSARRRCSRRGSAARRASTRDRGARGTRRPAQAAAGRRRSRTAPDRGSPRRSPRPARNSM